MPSLAAKTLSSDHRRLRAALREIACDHPEPHELTSCDGCIAREALALPESWRRGMTFPRAMKGKTARDTNKRIREEHSRFKEYLLEIACDHEEPNEDDGCAGCIARAALKVQKHWRRGMPLD